MRGKIETNDRMANIVADALWEGAVATAATTTMAALCGELENHRAMAPVNAVSHILWGDKATRQSRPSLKYTVPGLLLNGAAVTSWALLKGLMFGPQERKKSAAQALTEGAIISGIAYVTDYYVVPERLTPGFEHRLSNKSLAGIYGVLAVSLGLANWLRKQGR
jgi:hypothetical protein